MIAACVLSGLITGAAFPPFGISLIIWISLVPFFAALMRARSAASAGALGLVAGLSFFLTVLFWTTSLSAWAGGWGYTAWILLSLYQAAFMAGFSVMAWAALMRFKPLVSLFVVPLIWVVVEIARSCGEFGVPGGVLGYSQYLNVPVIQISAVFTVFGVSFLIVMFNTALAFLMNGTGRTKAIPFIIAAVIAGSSLVYGYSAVKYAGGPQGEPLNISVIQPNITQKDKLDPGQKYEHLHVLIKMTENASRSGPDLIIWPETAVMAYLDRDKDASDSVAGAAKRSGAWLLAGAFLSQAGKPRNSAVLFSPGGEMVSSYSKEHLVPFGEYLPFRDILYPLLRGTGYYENDQESSRYSVPISGPVKIGPMICFESLLPSLARKRSMNSDILVTLTNDAWFFSSAALDHHIMAAPFRSVENRKYFIQAANTGISAITDPYGRFILKSEKQKRQAITAEIFPGILKR